MNATYLCIYFWIFLSTSLIECHGKIIAFAGISGCGKTTMARLLAHNMHASCILEPEEEAWPLVIKQRETYGYASGLLAFRQLWAQQFIDAQILKSDGFLVFLDTYFFKIFGMYLGKPGMQWLIDPQDPYLTLLKELNRLDQGQFPDADCVVLFEISCDDWKKFLLARGRSWDQIEAFAQSHTYASTYIKEAVIEHCTNKNIPVMIFEQTFGNPQEQAQKLTILLNEQAMQKGDIK